MQVPNYVSLKTIIEGIYYNSGVEIVDFTEALFHTERIVGLLGIGEAYVDRITDGTARQFNPVSVTDYRGILPNDLIYINGVRDFKTKIALKETTDTFHLNSVATNGASSKSYEDTAWNAMIKLDESGNYDVNDPATRAMYFNNFENFQREALINLETSQLNSNVVYSSEFFYKVSNGTIFTSIAKLDLEIAYKAFLTDEEGFPMIPDDEYYKRAVESYIQLKLDYKLWRQGKLNQAIYNDSLQKYSWAVASAKGHLSVPTIDEMESIKCSYQRLITNNRAHMSGFKYNGNNDRMWRS